MPKPDRTGDKKEKRGGLRGAMGRLIDLCNNPMSAFGLTLVVLSLMLLATFALFSIITGRGNRYLEVVGFLVLPGVFILGLAIVPVGIVWSRWRLRHSHGRHGGATFHLNLADARTRGAVVIFLAVTVFIVLPGVAVSSYEGYVYTESTEFCATVCHTVMEPQGTAHASSAHARVTCAECHIGEGAGWFVKAKLSGTRQVLAVWRDSYSRPIPPAIRELRPARETCEQCHWPTKFFGAQYKEIAHYSSDEANTRRSVRLLLKTGGADETIGRVEGIHMHMMVDGAIEYVALDDHLQEIPWMRYTSEDGIPTVYRSDGLPSDAAPPQGVVRTIDCMDCHNRGAHHFRSPQAAVDLQLDAGRIDSSLPYIKRESVAALVPDYADVPAAESGIENALTSFYQQHYPDVWSAQETAVRKAVAAVQNIYRRNFFPEMNVTWRTYPENIGHLNSPGCFRCHDGLHVNAAGEAVTSDCTVCHDFLNPIDDRPREFREEPFEHSSMNMTLHKAQRCDQCHNGGPLSECRGCHESGQATKNWGHGRLRRMGSVQ